MPVLLNEKKKEARPAHSPVKDTPQSAETLASNIEHLQYQWSGKFIGHGALVTFFRRYARAHPTLELVDKRHRKYATHIQELFMRELASANREGTVFTKSDYIKKLDTYLRSLGY